MTKMQKQLIAAFPCGLLILLGLLPLACRASDPDPARTQALAACDVTWNTLGTYSADSLPLGNGDIGLNVWTEQNGDLLFYISKSDAWAENGNPVKVGRVRVSLNPNPFVAGAPFRQTLRLENGDVEIVGGDGAGKVTLRVWVDANHPVVRVEAAAARPVSMKVTLDPWRAALTEDPHGNVSADVVLPAGSDRLTWYHRDDKPRNAQLMNWTFGAMMQGDGLVRGDRNTLRSSAPRPVQRFSVCPLTAVTPTLEDWMAKLKTQAAALRALDWDKTQAAHQQWWRDFWGRSWIFLTGDADAPKVTQGYVLQRFVTACAGRGAEAIKYNGSLFTMDNPAEGKGRDKVTGKDIVEPVTADFRAWGGQYWFQNTRPEYWPLLDEGGFDEMRPLFTQYGNEIKNNAAAVKADYGHDGSYMAETAPFWGGIPNIKPADKGSYTFRYFTPVLEMTAMMLDYYDYTGDRAFLRETLLPIATAGLTFFEQHFPRDAQGRLLLDPDNAIEMYWDVRDPLPDIAGLHYDLARLLALPSDLVDPATRARWQSLQKILPPIPTGVKDGKTVLLPYAPGQDAPGHNTENPELYAVYPFRLYGLGKPDLDVALNTFDVRLNKSAGCWYQDPEQAALLGLTDLAKKDVTFNLTRSDPRLRFPAFWARGHDYMPDEDNGGNGQLGLQKMLMQCDGRRILLLPAWPAAWEADFRLHAPDQTIVEGHVKAGRITALQVTPAARRADVAIGPSLTPLRMTATN